MIADLRAGIAKNLTKIVGLRVSETLPDNPNPPVAVIGLNKVSYNKSFQPSAGYSEYDFTVTVIVSRVSERNAQAKLDAYCAPTGKTSVKEAIEKDRTLGGFAYDVRVTDLSAYGTITIADVDYLSGEFMLTVLAS